MQKNYAKQRLRTSNIKKKDLSLKIKNLFTDNDFLIIERITNKSNEKKYINQKIKLTKKFQNLSKANKMQATKMYLNLVKSFLKPAVLKFKNQEISQHHLEFLDLGLNFVPSQGLHKIKDGFTLLILCKK